MNYTMYIFEIDPSDFVQNTWSSINPIFGMIMICTEQVIGI